MRAKDIWEIFPLPAKIKLVWDRLTLTKTTTVYFVFSILHCVVQVVFQVHAFQINAQAAGFLASITERGNPVNTTYFYVFEDDLRLCKNPSTASFDTRPCQVIWNESLNSSADSTNSSRPSLISTPATTEDARNWNQGEWGYNKTTYVKRTSSNTIETIEANGSVRVVINSLGENKGSAILDRECLLVLGWPVQILRNTEREDLVFIMFQTWVLGMSIVAVLNESIPHMMATLLTHLAATGWTGFQIFNTFRFHSDFVEVTTNGACPSVDLLLAYWQSRADDELSSLILNSVALLISAFLCWKLAGSFGWQTFKRVGASISISRTYRIVLTLSIVIQLSLFFIVTSIALWLDQLWNGAIGHLAISRVYRPLLTITLLLLPVWLAFGWYSVRREQKTMMVVFLVMCCGYLAGWGAMFSSITFRWTYMTWPFFAVMTTASVFLTLLTFILGIICRINFGKGLPYYLKAHEPIEEGFEPVIMGDQEKVAFPTSKEPTFSVVFDSELMGMDNQLPIQQPSRAVTRTPSQHTYRSVHRESSQKLVTSSKTWL